MGTETEHIPHIWCDRQTGTWESDEGEVCQDHAVLMPCPYKH